MALFTEIKTAIPFDSQCTSIREIYHSISSGNTITVAYDVDDDNMRCITFDGLCGISDPSDIFVDCDLIFDKLGRKDYSWLIPVISMNGHKFYIALSIDRAPIVCDREIKPGVIRVLSDEISPLIRRSIIEE